MTQGLKAFAAKSIPENLRTGISDVKEILKTDTIVEFDQGLTED